jgi:DNA-binding GntR family transcriptional regulator
MIQKIGPVNLKNKVYEALKKYILSLNIYLKETDFHLDERQLSEKLGVSRTPIREAVARLEQEGIVKTVPRRGVFVHRKSKKELIDIVTVWAGLEGYAAHLIIQNSSKEEIEVLINIVSILSQTSYLTLITIPMIILSFMNIL